MRSATFEFSRMRLILCHASTRLPFFLPVSKWWKLPDRQLREVAAMYHLGEYVVEMPIRCIPCAPVGTSVFASRLGE